MSLWQLVNAWSGFHADLVDGTLAFAPKTGGDARLFWSAGTAWGELVRANGRDTLRVLGGSLPAVTVTVAGRTTPVPALKAGSIAELA